RAVARESLGNGTAFSAVAPSQRPGAPPRAVLMPRERSEERPQTAAHCWKARRMCAEWRALGDLSGGSSPSAGPRPSLEILGLFCYTERSSVFRNGNLGIHWSLGP